MNKMDRSFWEQTVRQAFDAASKEYARAYSGITPESHYFVTRQKIVLSFLDNLSGGRILDVGCGPGMMAEPCTQRGFIYTGLDISEKMIDECRRRYHNTASANFCVGRIQNLPFEDDFFDALLCMGALEYVRAEQQDDAMAEMIRVTKPGGLLIISHLNRLSPYRLWDKHVYAKARNLKKFAKRLLQGPSYSPEPEAPPRDFTEWERRNAIDARHLKIIDIVYFGFNVFPRPLDRLLPRLAVWTSEKLNSQSRGALRILGMAFVIAAQKAGYMNADVLDLVLGSAELSQQISYTTEKSSNKSAA